MGIKDKFIEFKFFDDVNPDCRKRSIPTHSERFYPPTIIAEMGLKRA